MTRSLADIRILQYQSVYDKISTIISTQIRIQCEIDIQDKVLSRKVNKSHSLILYREPKDVRSKLYIR